MKYQREMTMNMKTNTTIEALGQCIPPPRHVLPVSRYISNILLRKINTKMIN